MGLRTRALAVLASILPLAIGPAAARANADPASDFLPVRDVFLPLQAKVSPPVARALTDLLKRTRRAGYPLKVAVIATRADLGGLPQLFGRPQQYARFLDQEIGVNRRPPLLVVMPTGFGVVSAGAHATSALRGLGALSSGGSDAVARAAISAVVRLAKADGHPVATPRISGNDSSGGGPPAVVYILPVALLAAAGLALGLRRRRDAAGPLDPGS
jgi:MYXO-CTERM domain-containing protein